MRAAQVAVAEGMAAYAAVSAVVALIAAVLVYVFLVRTVGSKE